MRVAVGPLGPLYLLWNWVLIDILLNLCKGLGAGADMEERRGFNRPCANYPHNG